MSRRCTRVAVLIAFTALIPVGASSSQTRPITPPVAERNEPGRFQLLAQPEGTVFLVDTAQGRVWRYTVLKIPNTDPIPASEVEVLKYLDGLIATDEAAIGRRYTDAERASRREAL